VRSADDAVEEMTTLTLSGTASLLHNNLACSTSGWVATIHNSVNDAGGSRILLNKFGAQSKDGPEIILAMSLRYIDLPSGPVLVVSSTNGTQIYNEDATALLFFVPINDLAADTDKLKHHQGTCLVPHLQHIVVGTSKGSLMLVQATAPDFIALPECMPSQSDLECSGVADVCFCASTNQVVSAHSSGELRVWTVSELAPYENAHVVPAVGQAPVRVAALGARLLVAYGPGTICLFDAASYELQVEISAHARWVTAVDVREDLGFVASVGEDTALNVWTVDAGTGQVALQHTSVVTDKLLTGVAMFGSEVLVSSYDSCDLCRVGL